MKLSISNIAWDEQYDGIMYHALRQNGFEGLEIAPTRIIPNRPYCHLEDAKKWQFELKETYGLSVASIQSIWYGRTEKLFGTKEEREILLNYTKEAIDFASIMKCNNIVFGCPKNRVVPKGGDETIAVPFFRELSDYACLKETVLSLEANPLIYDTNYINTTRQAIEFVRMINMANFRVNLDVGTMIENNETVDVLRGNIGLINHVHISEPKLRLIKRRQLHYELSEILKAEGYKGYISIEMGQQKDIALVQDACLYLKEVFS